LYRRAPHEPAGGYPPGMKIGEWDGIGRARALIAHQLGELDAQELAAHVTV